MSLNKFIMKIYSMTNLMILILHQKNVSIFYIILVKVQTNFSGNENCILSWTEGVQYIIKKVK
jgi:hypothetical protein